MLWFSIFMFNYFSAYHIHLHAHFSKSLFLLEEITEHRTHAFSFPDLSGHHGICHFPCAVFTWHCLTFQETFKKSYFLHSSHPLVWVLKYEVFILQSTILPFSFLSLILSAPVDFQLMNLIWILPLQGCKSLFVSIFEQFASCQLFTIDNLMSNT